jgi:hypothetical protein
MSMGRMGIIAGVLAVLVLGYAGMNAVHADREKKPSLRHIVMYKFKDGLAPAKVEEVVQAFCKLPEKIPTIVDFERGTNVSPEGKSEGFTHVFVVTFASEKDRDDYLTHPAHLEYVSVVKDRREKVVVFDYWDEPAR